MFSKEKSKNILLLILITVLLALAFSTLIAWAEETEKELNFYVISHGGPADPFWGVVIKGVNDAAKQFNVNATYIGPEKFSITKMVDSLESAMAGKPDGIVATVVNVEALDEPLRRAIKQGIPVITINTCDPRPGAEKIPYLCFIGSDEYLMGVYSARRMLEAFKPNKPKRAVIAIHEPGWAGAEVRAQGMKAVYDEAGVPNEKLDTTVDPTKAVEILRSYLQKYPDTEAINTVGPMSAHPAIKFLEEEKLTNKVKMGAEDLTTVIVDAIKRGTCEFTIVQQQYLQGYLSVEFLSLYKRYGLCPVESVITGPSIVDKNNVDLVVKMVEEGYQ
ncbi:MAG: sugar ABC transporter substrate-binding protein [Atribacterota bacterium]|nr:sugar ABC transporter substrate-binding protein [Atribacterota bacterium]